MLFKAVVLTAGVGLGGRGLIQKMAEIDEMLVAGRPLGKLRPGPLQYEFFGSQSARPFAHRHIVQDEGMAAKGPTLHTPGMICLAIVVSGCDLSRTAQNASGARCPVAGGPGSTEEVSASAYSVPGDGRTPYTTIHGAAGMPTRTHRGV